MGEEAHLYLFLKKYYFALFSFICEGRENLSAWGCFGLCALSPGGPEVGPRREDSGLQKSLGGVQWEGLASAFCSVSSRAGASEAAPSSHIEQS